MEARNKYKDLPEPLPDAKAIIDNLPPDTLAAYRVFFASTHPECVRGLNNETRDAILGAILDRTYISYED
jgi:hypothetical protein